MGTAVLTHSSLFTERPPFIEGTQHHWSMSVIVRSQYSPRYILGFVFLISRSLNWLALFIYSHSSGLHSHYFTSASKLTLRNLIQIGHHQTAKSPALYMMTSSNGHMFLFTGPLWGEATGHQWIPLKRIPNKRLSKQSICWWFKTQLRPVWRHCNVTYSNSNVFCHQQLVLLKEMSRKYTEHKRIYQLSLHDY